MSTSARRWLLALALSLLTCAGGVFVLTGDTVPSPSEPTPPPPTKSPRGDSAGVLSPPSTLPSPELHPPEVRPMLEESPKPPSPSADPLVPTQLGIKLLGTMIADAPGMSLASIYEEATQRTVTVGVGSSLQGAEVVSIERARVVLSHSGRLEFVEVTLSEDAGASAAPPAPAVALPGLPSTLQQIGPETYVIQRKEVLEAIALRRKGLSEFDASFVFHEGKCRGFKVSTMTPNYVLARLGLENGDILLRINEFKMDMTPFMLKGFQQLELATHIEIDLERNGQPLHKTYTFEE